MKQIFILFVLVFTAFGVRADLVMELNLPILGLTNDTIIKIKGDKIRQDSVLNGQKASSRIADLKTGEIFTWGDMHLILILPIHICQMARLMDLQ